MSIPLNVLNENEQQLYFYLLANGATTAQNIYKGVKGISRSNVYEILDKLIQKKLIFIDRKAHKKNIYVPDTPTKLLELVNRKMEHIETTKEHLKKMLPNLEEQYLKLNKLPVVQYFHGEEGIREMLYAVNDSQDVNTPRLTIFSGDKVEQRFPYGKQDKRRANPKYNYKIIYTYNKGKLHVLHSSKKYNSLRVGLNNEFHKNTPFDIAAEILLYENKVAIADADNNIGMIIANDSINKTLSYMFNMLFEYIKNDPKNQLDNIKDDPNDLPPQNVKSKTKKTTKLKKKK